MHLSFVFYACVDIIINTLISIVGTHLLGSFTLPHCIFEIDKPGPVEQQSGDAEDKVECQVGLALMLAAVHQHTVGHQEGEAQDNVHISENNGQC